MFSNISRKLAQRSDRKHVAKRVPTGPTANYDDVAYMLANGHTR